VSEALYMRIERSCRVKREQIPEKLETFHLALQELTGASANVVERLIAKELRSRIQMNFRQNAKWILVDYAEHANKAQFDEQTSNASRAIMPRLILIGLCAPSRARNLILPLLCEDMASVPQRFGFSVLLTVGGFLLLG